LAGAAWPGQKGLVGMVQKIGVNRYLIFKPLFWNDFYGNTALDEGMASA
jgi:hypothetical protein